MIFNKKEKEKDENKIEVDPELFLASCSANFKKASMAFENLSKSAEGLIIARRYEARIKEDPTLDLTSDPEFIKSMLFVKNADGVVDEALADIQKALKSLNVICSMKVKVDNHE